MNMRVGKVTNVYSSGKVKVLYEDEKSSSLPLPMLTMNKEFSMPSVGDRVVAIHMENGSSKGFVLGTYYGENNTPSASSGYRKDFGCGAYAACQSGSYVLHASDITLETSYGNINAEDLLKRLERIEDSLGLPHTIE